MTKEYDMEALRVALDEAREALLAVARHELPEWLRGRMECLRYDIDGFCTVAWPKGGDKAKGGAE